MLSMKISTKQVESIITTLANIPSDKRPVTPEGHLDVAKLNEMPEVKAVVMLLQSIGVKDTAHLMKLGFIAGAMVLRF